MISCTNLGAAASVLAVSFGLASVTYAQGSASVADQVTIVPASPDMRFTRHVVGADGGSAGAAGERLVYSNTLGKFAFALGGGNLVADDLTITVPGGCKLTRYEFPVVGKVDPVGIGGPYTVDFALYRSCPGSVSVASRPSLIIPGTQGQSQFLDDAPRLISFVAGPNVPLQTNMWLGVQFSRNNAGVIVGTPPMTGFSCDQFDFPGYPCNINLGGFPDQPQGSFNLEIFADSACSASFTGYKDDRPSGSTYNPGQNIVFADDIHLVNGGCNLIAYEVAVKGVGFYTFDMRLTCEGPAIPGTEQSLSVGSGTQVKILRFIVNPPVPLPQNLWFSAKISNAAGGVVIAGQQACIGSTEDLIEFVGPNGCDIVPRDILGTGVHGAFSLTITCAGPAPVGACCDMFMTDPDGAAVCRQVPETNCPFPPRFSSLQPTWVDGEACEPDPFPFPCGVSACCRPDQVCENLTQNECNAVPPIDRPRQWQLGRYCDLNEQDCPFVACLLREGGGCLVAHQEAGCEDADCCTDVCNADSYCCLVEWDRVCVQHADEMCPSATTNDECGYFRSPALSVESDSATVFSNIRATESPSDSGFCCRSDAPGAKGFGTVWFKFTATDTSAKISTCNSDPTRDSLFQVFAAGDPSCNNLTMIACSDDVDDCGGGRHGKICVRHLTPGQTYYVMVAAKTPETKGVYELDIRSPCFDEPIWIGEDCNGNGLQDGCELGSRVAADCNGNHVLDECDIASGTSLDCDADGFLDECTGVVETLRPPSPAVNGGFGHSLDMQGEWLVIGTSDFYATPTGGDNLYIFRRAGAGWAKAAEFFLPDAPAYVALDGDWIVTGSDHDSVAHLFRFDGTQWSPAGSLQGPEVLSCPRYGFPVAVHGDVIALGKGSCLSGWAALPEEVYIFRFDGVQWVERARIQAPDPSRAGGFGASVSLDAGRLLVGAPYTSSERGAAYIFRPVGEVWMREATLTPSAEWGYFFGQASVLKDDMAFVGGFGYSPVYVFRRSGSSWAQDAKLAASDGSWYSGWSVRVAGNTLVVGATTTAGDGEGWPGAVYVFSRRGLQWIETAKLVPPDEFAADSFGHGLATNGSLVAIGAPATNWQSLANAGTAYVYQPPQDCNGNGIRDFCEIRDGTAQDCNADGAPDECDIVDGASLDCQPNGIPDECEIAGNIGDDCNGNSIPDDCEIAAGTSADCDGNGVLDECSGVVATFRPPSPAINGGFGHSLDMQGEWMVIGTSDFYTTPTGGDNLYIYRRAGAGWAKAGEFFLPDAPAYVDLDGDWVVAGSDHDSVAHLFHFDGTQWSPAGSLQGPEVPSCARYGFPVAVQGNLMALGQGFCQFELGGPPRVVYVFRFDGVQWTEEARVEPPQGTWAAQFGASVSFSGDRLLIGNPAASIAFIFRCVGEVWEHEATLSPPPEQSYNFFGRSSVLHGDLAFVGATLDEGPHGQSGAVYLFRRSGSSWTRDAKLTASDAFDGQRLGWSLRVAENTLAVGATNNTGQGGGLPGSAYVFSRRGLQWIETAKLVPPGGIVADSFGNGVATDGSLVAVGAPATQWQSLANAGTAYVYQQQPHDCNKNDIPDLCDVRDGTSADCNHDDVPDECDTLPPFDYDFDGDVDLFDLAGFMRCFTGPGPATVAPCCRMFDVPPDGDVDADDWAGFLVRFQGP